MRRHVARLLGVSACLVCWASEAPAQDFDVRPVTLGQPAAKAAEGVVHGVVRDDAGSAVAGANVVALGGAPLPFIARSNATGEFTLSLPPGEYVIRAIHDGYISAFREPVEIQKSTDLQRDIVLVRRPVRPAGGGVVTTAAAGLPVLGAPEEAQTFDPADTAAPSDHPHDERAWRLRHLTPTALRDVGGSERLAGDEHEGFQPRPSFVDWIMGESARAAASFFTNTDFTGQVNFLTTGSLAAAAGGSTSAELPHGVAFIAVGAPVGSAGDWSVRGALSASALASWVVLGEYTARSDQPHAFHAGVSYSSQPIGAPRELAPAAMSDRVRSVGGIYGVDRWQIHPALEVDYGLRVDRYDYVADSEFVSPQAGFRVRVLPGTHVALLASQYVIAPGANEFLPPTFSATWVPPERTFAPLLPGAAFRAERVRNVRVGIERRLFASEDAPVLALQRFRESTRDQISTLFGLDAERGVGHYYVATPGSVDVDGWIVRLTGRLLPGLTGMVAYTTSGAEWATGGNAGAIALIVPSVVRSGHERLHDVTTSLNATIPETSTRVRMAYRVNTAFGAADHPGLPAAAGRFNVEVRQGLPVRVARGSTTELVVVLRNLFRDLSQPGSLYDELLTVAPPLRVMGGVQVRF